MTERAIGVDTECGGRMVITVKLFGHLRDYLPEKTTLCRAEAAEGATVGDVLDDFGVPRDKPRVILVNSYRSRLDHVLEDGDVVAAFQVLAGG